MQVAFASLCREACARLHEEGERPPRFAPAVGNGPYRNVEIGLSPIQAKSKFSQIKPNRATLEQNLSKKEAWFSLDFLVRFEPFQGLALTPGPKNYFWRPSAV
jgi:hypothetical protein